MLLGSFGWGVIQNDRESGGDIACVASSVGGKTELRAPRKSASFLGLRELLVNKRGTLQYRVYNNMQEGWGCGALDRQK